MYGAIIGDINGSIYEFDNYRRKDFTLFSNKMYITDDSVLTIAVMKTFIEVHPFTKEDINNINWQKEFKSKLVKNFIDFVYRYPHSGFGGFFRKWSTGFNNYQPYNSYGNGSAMRVSPVGWVSKDIEEVKVLSRLVTEITHNHPEGIKGAEVTSICIYLARTGKTKEEIKDFIRSYYPQIDSFDYDDLVKHYRFNEICQTTVPEALYCFLISSSYEDSIRTTVGMGGDCDTTAAISCAVAEAYYGVDSNLNNLAKAFIPKELQEIIDRFDDLFIK